MVPSSVVRLPWVGNCGCGYITFYHQYLHCYWFSWFVVVWLVKNTKPKGKTILIFLQLKVANPTSSKWLKPLLKHFGPLSATVSGCSLVRCRNGQRKCKNDPKPLTHTGAPLWSSFFCHPSPSTGSGACGSVLLEEREKCPVPFADAVGPSGALSRQRGAQLVLLFVHHHQLLVDYSVHIVL